MFHIFILITRLIIILPARVLHKVLVTLELGERYGPEIHLIGEGRREVIGRNNLVELVFLCRSHKHIQSVNLERLLDRCIHPAAQIEVTLALAKEFYLAFTLNLGTERVLVAILGLGIVGQSGTNTNRLHTLLYLVYVA